MPTPPTPPAPQTPQTPPTPPAPAASPASGSPFTDPKVLGEELRDLLKRHSTRLALRKNELTVLAEDLTQSNRLSTWAEVDLVHSYVRPESLSAPPDPAPGRPWWQRAPRYGLLEAVLGVLVFIPLLVTWFGLREAVRAYGELSETNPEEATRPFLQLWQTGFDGHLGTVGHFENVALMAVLLITLLVLLSVWHATARTRAERDEEARHAEDEELLGKLASLLTRVQLYLAPHRAASPAQFTTELTRAARQLQDLLRKSTASHKGLVASAKAVGDATDTLREATGALAAEVPGLARAADRVETAVKDGTAASQQIRQDSKESARTIADKVQAATDGVRTAFKELVAEQKALAAEQKALASKSGSTAQAAEQAARAVTASAARTNDVADGLREATERWDAAAAHWQDASARLEKGLRTLAPPPPPGQPLPEQAAGARGPTGTVPAWNGGRDGHPDGGGT